MNDPSRSPVGAAEPRANSTASGASDSSDTDWLTRREKGTLLGILAAYAVLVLLGRTLSKGFVAVLSFWYFALSGSLRSISRQWLLAALGREPRLREIYRHFRLYTQVTVDRVFLLKEKFSLFEISRNGDEHLHRVMQEGTGAILVSAHIGSFEAMRADGNVCDIPINIVGHFENARMINSLFERLSPETATRVIHVGKGGVDFIYAVKDAIERGELVGVMADRVGLSERSIDVDFMGRKARFASGPFVLGAVLGCPVFATFGLYVEPNKYKLFCEPLMPAGKLARKNRNAAIEKYARAFAQRLEHHAKMEPYNWFNFFDFWAPGDASRRELEQK